MMNFKKLLFPEKEISTTLERLFFYYDLYTTNISRLIIVSYALIFGLSGILIFDLIRYWNHSLNAIGKELALTHIIFFIFSVGMIIISKIIIRKVQRPFVFRIYVWLVVLCLFALTIWTTLIDQKVNGQITVLIMGIFGISALLYLFPVDSLILYMIAIISFMILLPGYQNNPDIIVSHYINIPVLGFISFSISFIFFRSKVKDFIKSKKIEQTNMELDELIQKLLPEQIAFQLRKEHKIQPMINKNVTIVFIDFVSFSRIVESMDIYMVLQTLDKLFSEFDAIIKKYKLEKIKTIGDSYMYAGGLFSSSSQAKECVDSALEILDLLKEKQEVLQEKTQFLWQVRIGMNVGDLVSGIIGDWRFVFDVWGNTVNVASRLESVSEAGKLNVSRNVYEQIRYFEDYYFEPRGKVPIKNLGSIEMFFVSRSKKMLSI